MLVAAIGIVLSIVGIFMVRTKEDADTKSLLRSLLTGTLGSSILVLITLFVLVKLDFISLGIFGSVLSGLAAGVLIGQFTEYYTSDAYKPTRGIAGQAKLGAATTIIDGISVGMFSTGLPVVTIVIGIIAAFGCAGGFQNMAMGLYGVGFAAVGMLSTLGITLAFIQAVGEPTFKGVALLCGACQNNGGIACVVLGILVAVLASVQFVVKIILHIGT